MSTFDFTFDEDLVEEAEQGGGSFGVLDTEIYPVTINFASLGKTEKGNNTMALDITTDTGHQTTIWAAFGTIDKTWSSGSENYGYKDFQALMAACGAKTITPTPYKLLKEDGTAVQKDGKDVVLSVVKELHGVKCKLALQKEFDWYNGAPTEKNIIHSSYNAKGQTYLEAKNDDEAKKIEKVGDRLQDKYTKRFKQNNTDGGSAEPEEEIEVGGLL